MEYKRMILEHCNEKYHEYLDLYLETHDRFYLGRANSYLELDGFLSVILADDSILDNGESMLLDGLDKVKRKNLNKIKKGIK